ncbi:MAG: hypothetical protein ACK553_03185 [Planctomycetota bacterium]|jgi:hypothetical protein
MAATATLKKPVKPNFVQQTFQWDDSLSRRGASSVKESEECTSTRVSSFPKKSKPLAVSSRGSERLGRCEPVGGLMQTVLSRYGITPEEFRQAVEELRASRGIQPGR